MKLSRRQLAERVALDDADKRELQRCRGDHNRLGFAYQVGFVKLMGRLPQQQPLEIVDELVVFAGLQAGVPPPEIGVYRDQQLTIQRHQARIREYMGLSRLSGTEAKRFQQFVFDAACRLENSASLILQAKQFLHEQRILQPAESTLVRIVGEHRERARQQIFERIAADVEPRLADALDALLKVEGDERISALQRIKANPSKASTDGILVLVDKLQVIEATGALGVDLSWLSGNYQRSLYHYARKAHADRLRELAAPRRRATLVCFLWQSYKDAVDQLVDMFDKLLTRMQTQAQHEIDERMRRQRVLLRTSLTTLQALGQLILDEDIKDADLRSALFKQVSREDLSGYVKDVTEWVSGRSSHTFHGVMKRYTQLRKFAPALLSALKLRQDTAELGPTLEALEVLAELNEAGKRKLPKGVPVDFVPKTLRPFVEPDGHPERRAWECALLLKVRDDIRAGNVSVDHSKRFGPLDTFFMPVERWSAVREGFFRRADLPVDARQVPDYLGHRLGQAYDRFLEAAPSNSYASVDEDGWRLSVDPAERLDGPGQAQLDRLKGWLSRSIRRINLADLLIEVDNELGFTRHFLPPSQAQPAAEDVCVVLAAVMAHGCNIGPYTMSQLTRGISYKQLKRVSDWQLTEEAQRGALAEVVSAIAALDTSLYWGEGRASASDGQRFAMPRKVLQQTYSPKFSDFALEFYTFVADNYAPFYSSPIECTDRDAAFVLDGLLYNESELQLEEHYTDTHGYTEINFSAFAMLGRRFCPRIKGVKKQRLYRIDKERDYGALAPLVGRADRTINARIIAEQWDRMGHLFASLEAGHATASVVLKRLAASSAKNQFYRANRDLGRILKTEFILQYMSEPALRGRVRRGLLKVEQLHALARDVFYGRRGRINARELWEQMNSCSCLTLIVACIVYWQAREMSRAIRQVDTEAEGLDLALLEHVSPIEWDNVVLYGQYVLQRSRVRPWTR